MDCFGMGTGLGDPAAHGAGLEAPGGDNGFNRTAMGDQGENQRNERRIGVLAEEGRARAGREGLATDPTAVTLWALRVNGHVALVDLAPGRTGRIGAKLAVRI